MGRIVIVIYNANNFFLKYSTVNANFEAKSRKFHWLDEVKTQVNQVL